MVESAPPIKRDLCFNRTFMELKSDKKLVTVHLSVSFNRTFMELKSLIKISCNIGTTVLIVPLWN